VHGGASIISMNFIVLPPRVETPPLAPSTEVGAGWRFSTMTETPVALLETRDQVDAFGHDARASRHAWILPPIQHCGMARAAIAMAYHLGPSPRFHVTTTPTSPRTTPTTPRIIACLIGLSGASLAVSHA